MMKPIKAPHKYIQWAIAYALFSLGFFALLVMAGDDDPAHPISNFDWIAIKVIAAAVIYACYLVGKYLYTIGYLPVMDLDEEDEEDFYE